MKKNDVGDIHKPQIWVALKLTYASGYQAFLFHRCLLAFAVRVRLLFFKIFTYEYDCCLPSFYHTRWSPVKCISLGYSKKTCRLCLHTISFIVRAKQENVNPNFLKCLVRPDPV